MQLISLDITSLLIRNIEKIFNKIRNKKYASRRTLTYLFEIIDDILSASKLKIDDIKKEISEVKTTKEKHEILRKNYDLNKALNYIFPIIHHLSFSNINFIDFDDYAIIEYISSQIETIPDLKDKSIICLISASLPKMNFEVANYLFEFQIREYFERLSVNFPEYSIHIRYPLLFKNNFLLKTSFFHEYSHLIDRYLNISENYEIKYKKYDPEITELAVEFQKAFNDKTVTIKFLNSYIRVRLNEILNNWINELVADIISALVIGPASRKLLMFFDLKEGALSFNETHPPFYLRCKTISKLLNIYEYKNTEEENSAEELVKLHYHEPSTGIYKLIIKIIEAEIDNLIDTCIKNFPSSIKKTIEFLKEDNLEKKNY